MKTLGADRIVVPQLLESYALAVPATPARRPLSDVVQSLSVQLIDSIILSLHEDAGSIVYVGGPGVTAGVGSNGLALSAGEKIQYAINNERPLYEIQDPLVDAHCTTAKTIPLVVWQLDNIFVTADAGPTILVVQLFQVPFR